MTQLTSIVVYQINIYTDSTDYMKSLQEIQLHVQAEIARIGAERAKEFPLYNKNIEVK